MARKVEDAYFGTRRNLGAPAGPPDGPAASSCCDDRQIIATLLHHAHAATLACCGESGEVGTVLGDLVDRGLGDEDEAGDGSCGLQCRAGNLDRVVHAHLDHVAVLAGCAVQAFTGGQTLNLLDHNGAFEAGVLSDRANRCLEGLANDIDTDELILIGGLDLVELGDNVEQSDAAARNDALFDSCARCLQRVLDAGLLLLELGLGCSTDLEHCHAAGELGEALLELLAVEVGLGAIELGLDLGDAVLNILLIARAVDDERILLGDLDGLRSAEHVDGDVGKRHTEDPWRRRSRR